MEANHGLKRYHQPSKVESVYSALKRCYGNHLSSRKRTAQRRELHLKMYSRFAFRGLM